MPPEHRAELDALRASEAGKAEPQTIEEALMQSGMSGTHSILDICLGVAESSDYAKAFPMPADVLTDVFGTTRPTREQVEAHKHARGDLERMQCWYVIVYKDGRPDEIYFEGCSGD